MSTPEPPTNPEPTPQPGVSQAVAPHGSGVPGRAWVLALVAAIVAGAGSWAVVEGLLQAYKKSFQPISFPYPSAEDVERITRARIESGNIAFGVTGGLVGLGLGLAGGISRKSLPSAASAGAIGLLLGGLVEAGMARLVLWLIYRKFDAQTEDMLHSLLGHEALWVPIGFTGGLAFGLGLGGRGRWWRAAIGGLFGSALAMASYEILGALAFATHGTHQPLADTPETRALAQILVPLGAAIGAILSASDPKKTSKAPAQS